MTQIKCSVSSCSYNKDYACYVNPVNIGGKGAPDEECTCCGSFLSRQNYSNLAEYTSMRSEVNTVNCVVNTCEYNKCDKCTKDHIDVGGNNDACIYSETECNSFHNVNK